MVDLCVLRLMSNDAVVAILVVHVDEIKIASVASIAAT